MQWTEAGRRQRRELGPDNPQPCSRDVAELHTPANCTVPGLAAAPSGRVVGLTAVLALLHSFGAADGRAKPAGDAPDRPKPNAAAAAPAHASAPYADDFAALSPAARELQRSPAGRFSYCLRSTAVYDCLSYAYDGTVQHRRYEKTAHGTAFAYRRSGNDTLLATNEHVVAWPVVTSDESPLDDVPHGCKRVETGLRIVDAESDREDHNDVPLTQVVADSLLDVAVLRARVPLTVMPFAIGRSVDLRVGNVVTIQGYPLGVLETTNTGKVINSADHDTAHDRDHLDFVIDAPLSPGNSGSPVLAVNKKSGRPELVGIYHAAYSRGEGLNVVVAIDQVLDLLILLRRSSRAEAEFDRVGPSDRRSLTRFVRNSGGRMLFGLGGALAAVQLLDTGDLLFELYAKGLPLTEDRVLLWCDEADATNFGRLKKLFVGDRGMVFAVDELALEPAVRAQLQRLGNRLRTEGVWTMRWRTARDAATRDRDQRALDRWRNKNAALANEAAAIATDLAAKSELRVGSAGRPVGAVLAELYGLPHASTPTVSL